MKPSRLILGTATLLPVLLAGVAVFAPAFAEDAKPAADAEKKPKADGDKKPSAEKH